MQNKQELQRINKAENWMIMKINQQINIEIKHMRKSVNIGNDFVLFIVCGSLFTDPFKNDFPCPFWTTHKYCQGQDW